MLGHQAALDAGGGKEKEPRSTPVDADPVVLLSSAGLRSPVDLTAW